jgi:2-polyprenyl-3-methyl-5-hydroxy-6-metoxy-1,4-benzoquinol methylase
MNEMTEHWKNKSKYPDAIDSRIAMKRILEKIMKGASLDRIKYIKDVVKGRRTLDIGCVQHDASRQTKAEWLHDHIVNSASFCLGLDILESDIQSLRSKGYNVLCHDLTIAPVKEKFEVIVCGEIVEHIGNIDGLLQNCRQCLEPGGQLILSTPYPWFIGVSLRHMLAQGYLPGSLDHVAWYDPVNFSELAARHGYVLEMYAGIEPRPVVGGWKRNAFEAFCALVRKGSIPLIAPLSGCRSVLYVLKCPDL